MSITTINEIVERFMRSYGALGVILKISQGDRTIINRGYGVNPECERNNPAMHTRIGSVTKTMTCFIILQLIDEGVIAIDDLLSRWFPDLENSNLVTIKMLTNMTSGIPSFTLNPELQSLYDANPRRAFTTAELIAFAYAQPYMFTPGTQWFYSNTNSVLLGAIIERVTSKPLHVVFQERISAQFSLTQTTYPTTDLIAVPYLDGYDLVGGRYVNTTYNNPSALNAAGAVISSIPDLERWSRIIGTCTALQPAQCAQRVSRDTVGLPIYNSNLRFRDDWYYGMNIFYDNGWLYHNGELAGYYTMCSYLPALGVSINLAIGITNYTIRRNLADILWGELATTLYPDYAPYFPPIVNQS